ncbi:MAG: hypothetical protein Q9182_007493 [Xanthomendoza sp. 2 TL-2023]
MSSQAPGASGAPEEERKGLSKFVRRASKVFRRRSSARGSISGPSDLVQTSSGAAATGLSEAPVVSPPPIAETPVEEQPVTAIAPAPLPVQQTTLPETVEPPNARLATTALESGTILEERARALFAKYGLTLEPGEWTSPIKPNAERVEKKIRMRIHRACHHCQTTFGADRVCNNCSHHRCKKCPRYPTKKAKEPKSQSEPAGGAPTTVGHTVLNLKSLTISSRATGKQISYKPATQRYVGTFDANNVLESQRRRRNIQQAIRATAITAPPSGNGIRSGSMSGGLATNVPGRSKTYRDSVKGVDTIVATTVRGSHQSERSPGWIRTL